MNKYRNFKYPFGGETPDEFAAARQQYYANESDRAYQNLDNTGTVVDPSTLIKTVNERNRSEIQRRVQSMDSRPKDGGTIVKNHDRLYDYYKVGDRLYYRKKGGKNWINISDNEIAQKRINATIAKNKKSYGGNKNAAKSTSDSSSDLRAQGFVQNDKGYWVRPEDLKESTTYDAGTLNEVVVTGTRHNSSSTPRRVQGSTAYKATPQTQEDRWRKGKPGYIITRGAQKAIDFVKSLANKERNNNSNGYISRSQYMAKYHRDRLNQK